MPGLKRAHEFCESARTSNRGRGASRIPSDIRRVAGKAGRCKANAHPITKEDAGRRPVQRRATNRMTEIRFIISFLILERYSQRLHKA